MEQSEEPKIAHYIHKTTFRYFRCRP